MLFTHVGICVGQLRCKVGYRANLASVGEDETSTILVSIHSQWVHFLKKVTTHRKVCLATFALPQDLFGKQIQTDNKENVFHPRI